jgi:Rrf2 family protein
MVKINRKVEYALMVLKYMSERSAQHLTTAREICEAFSTPFDTTSKVMQQMNAVGILCSVKGVNGGYFLSTTLDDVSYLQLVELIEGRKFGLDCHEGPCELLGQCNISKPIARLNDYLIRIFGSLTLKELLAEGDLQLQLSKSPSELPTKKEFA